MKRLRIALLAPEYRYVNGGVGIYARELHALLRSRKDIVVTLFSNPWPSTMVSHCMWMLSLRRILRNRRFDIIHNLNMLHCSDLFVKNDAVRVATVHSTVASQATGILRAKAKTARELLFLIMAPVLRILEQFYVKRTHLLLLVAEHQKKRFPNARALPLIAPLPPPASLPRQLEGKRFVLYVGRHLAQKGTRIIIQAVHCTPYTIVTVGAYADAFRRRARLTAPEELRSGKLVILGFQDRKTLAALYANCEAVILPSHQENAPLVCYEAMQAGKAVIAMESGRIRTMLEHKGLLSRTPEGFLRNLRAFHAHPREVMYAYDPDAAQERFEERMIEAYHDAVLKQWRR